MKRTQLEKTELERKLEEQLNQEAQDEEDLQAETAPEGDEVGGEDAPGQDDAVAGEAGEADESGEAQAPEQAPEEAPEEATEEAPEQAPEEELTPEERIAALTAEVEDLNDRLLRARAEFDNYRKRVARENQRVRNTAAESLICDLLPVVDHLELALQHKDDESGGFSDGVEMVFKQLCEALEQNGLEAIPALGEPFDPHVHEAITKIESEDVAEDSVAIEFQRGYTLGGLVLRHSKVAVSMGGTEKSKKDT